MAFLESFYRGLLDIVYPPKCLVCGRMQPYPLCGRCAEKIEVIGPSACPRCGFGMDSEVCWECHDKRFYFDSAHCYGYYTGALREAIHQFKYAAHRELAPVLAEFLLSMWKGDSRIPYVDCVVPIPIHKKREQERGFNQSRLLAENVAQRFALALAPWAIVRIRPTRPQVELDLHERAANVKGVFDAGRESVEGRHVLLIDDVFTTGSTLDDAARALKAAGALRVHALALARSV